MRAIGVVGAAIVSVVLGVGGLALADQGRPSQKQNGSKHQQSGRVQERKGARHGAWQQQRARSWESDHRSWQQRGGYEGYRVPDDRFRRYFGPQHGFRINRRPLRIVEGRPRFQYRGYWFSLIDPWPEYWESNWYDTDDVYVGQVDDGYYLFNRRHPNVGLTLRISM